MLNQILSKKILRHPHKKLLTATNAVTEFDNELRKQAQKMLFVMHQCEGIGLAANQLGFTNAVFVYTFEEKNYVCINPVIEIIGDEKQDKQLGIEGCLSIDDQWLYVPRYEKLKVTYQNLYGELLEREIEGYEARVVQHECDHLLGKTILDYNDIKDTDI